MKLICFVSFFCSLVIITNAQNGKKRQRTFQPSGLIESPLAQNPTATKYRQQADLINNYLKGNRVAEDGSKTFRIEYNDPTNDLVYDVTLNDHYLKYIPIFPMRLGYGLTFNDLSLPHLSAIDYEIKDVEGEGSLQTSFEAKLVTNYSDLRDFMEIDYKTEVSFFGFGGGGLKANFNKEITFTENSLYLIIK